MASNSFLRPSHWRRQLAVNPVLRLETTLWPGRPRWKSPVVWLLAIFAVAFTAQVGVDLYFGLKLHATVGPFTSGVKHALGHHPWKRANLTLFLVWFVPLLMMVIVIPFTSWRRDAHPATREMIALSGLTADQLLDARARCWAALALAISTPFFLLDILVKTLAATSFDSQHSYLWYFLFHGEDLIFARTDFLARNDALMEGVLTAIVAWLVIIGVLHLLISLSTLFHSGFDGAPILLLLPVTVLLLPVLVFLARGAVACWLWTNVVGEDTGVDIWLLSWMAAFLWGIERFTWSRVRKGVPMSYGIGPSASSQPAWMRRVSSLFKALWRSLG